MAGKIAGAIAGTIRGAGFDPTTLIPSAAKGDIGPGGLQLFDCLLARGPLQAPGAGLTW